MNYIYNHELDKNMKYLSVDSFEILSVVWAGQKHCPMSENITKMNGICVW